MRPDGRELSRHRAVRHGAGAVAVGVSGGVDSAVAALLLRDAGYRVHAVFLRLWPGDDPRSCCSPSVEARAREVARRLSVPFSVLDLRAEFETHVVTPFVDEYLAGLTPNPCVACNPFRFPALAAWAAERGVDRVASGHYARIEEREGQAWLRRGVDAVKDQSYMLARLPPAVLEALLLPVGEMEKDAVRTVARRAGLPPAETAESQEVCFAVDGYRAFLRGRGVAARPGGFVTESGVEIGRHDGHWEFTVGQRRGLAIGRGEALYVLERRAARNEVVVGPRERLQALQVEVDELDERAVDIVECLAPGGDRCAPGSAAPASTAAAAGALYGGLLLPDGSRLAVQLRYRSPAVPVAAVAAAGRRRARLRLARPFAAAAPGQAAVLYAGDRVIGGGRIVAAATGSAEVGVIPFEGRSPEPAGKLRTHGGQTC